MLACCWHATGATVVAVMPLGLTRRGLYERWPIIWRCHFWLAGPFSFRLDLVLRLVFILHVVVAGWLLCQCRCCATAMVLLFASMQYINLAIFFFRFSPGALVHFARATSDLRPETVAWCYFSCAHPMLLY